MSAIAIKNKVDSTLYLLVEYQINAFLFHMKIFPEESFCFNKNLLKIAKFVKPLPEMFGYKLSNTEDTIENWLSDIKKLISKKKTLKLILNCTLPNANTPSKQLVITISEIKNYLSGIKSQSQKKIMKSLKIQLSDYLIAVSEEYKNTDNNKPFYSIKGAMVNMTFVYKKNTETIDDTEGVLLTQTMVTQQDNFCVEKDILQYRIRSRVILNDSEDAKKIKNWIHAKKKRKMSGTVRESEPIITKKRDGFIYSDIEESEEENDILAENSTTKVSNGSKILLKY